MVHPDNTLIEIPIVLRDLIAENRLHPRQPYYELVEDAVLLWLEWGGWWEKDIPYLEPSELPMNRPRRSGPVRPVQAKSLASASSS